MEPTFLKKGKIQQYNKPSPTTLGAESYLKPAMDRDLDALLSTSARDDGTDPEFEELWTNMVHLATRRPPQQPAPAPARASERPPSDKLRPTVSVPTTRLLKKPPRVGTRVERSSGDQAKKLAALMAEPPPLPRRRPKQPIRPIRPIRPIKPATAKDQLTELFGGTLSDVSDEEQPKEAAAPATTPQSSTSERPTQIAVPPPSRPPTQAIGFDSTTPTYGPPATPPISVDLGHGVVVSVPHFAAHISRRYKARVGNRRFMLRFDHTGRCRYHREIRSDNHRP